RLNMDLLALTTSEFEIKHAGWLSVVGQERPGAGHRIMTHGRETMSGPTLLSPGADPDYRSVPVLPAGGLQFRPIGPDEDPTSRLLAQIEILGTRHHLEAYRVHERPIGGSLVANDPEPTTQECDGPAEIQYMFQDYYQASGAEGAWNTVEIAGNKYVLV